MKRIFALILSLVFCFTAVSCSDPGDISPGPTETAQPAVNTPEANATEHTHDDPDLTGAADTPTPTALPASTRSLYPDSVPEYTTGHLIHFNEGEDFYVTMKNCDWDIYPDTYWGGPGFFIFLKEKKDVQVRIRSKNSVEIDVLFYEDEQICALAYDGKGSYSPYGLTYENYLCLGKIDIEAYCNAAIEFEKLREKVANGTATEEERNAFYADASPVIDLENAYKRDYLDYDVSELPKYAVCRVSILFNDMSHAVDETIHEIELIIDGESHKLDIGEWRIHSTTPDEIKYEGDKKNIFQINMCSTYSTGTMYMDGYARIDEALYFKAMKDLTVTGVRFYCSDDTKVLGARVRDGGEGDGSIGEYYWDMKMPLDFKAGQTPSIDIIIKNDKLCSPGYSSTIIIVMDYEVNGRPHQMLFPAAACVKLEIWDCILDLEGYDVGKYYFCYDTPFNQTWIRTLPESWLEDAE